MGSYAVVKIGNVELYWSKYEIDPAVMILYTEEDKKIKQINRPSVENREIEEDEIPYEFEVKYVAKLDVVKDRLEFLGFTLPKAKETFNENLSKEIPGLEEMKSYSKDSDTYQETINEEISVLKELTFEKWLMGFTEIIKRGLKPTTYIHKDDLPADTTPLLRYMMHQGYDEFYGFPTYDFRVFLRAAVEITGTEDELIYDISDLVASGDVDRDDDLCLSARWQLAEDFVVNHKIIVLTEGISDSRSLQASLKLLYPHLYDYYSFMDFEGARVQGSAGALVSIIKAFIGAGIVNRVVAFFDNDTAARAAVRALRGINIPSNVKISHYPEIDIARNYPTLGPQGTVNMDVNGLAGSLELYLGEEIIRDNDGRLTPIQWRGYDEGLKQYQGEIMHKDELQSRFSEKIKKCESTPETLKEGDWTGMKAILEKLRTAFHE